MPHDPEEYLQDVIGAARFRLELIPSKSEDDYRRDRVLRSAVERELQIVGEAVLQLSRAAPDVAARISEYQRIIGFRHVLVHGYDSL